MLLGLGSGAVLLVEDFAVVSLYGAVLAGVFILLTIASRNSGNRFALNVIA